MSLDQPLESENKTRTRLVAARHSLTGQVAVLPLEDRQAFDEFASGIVASLMPETVHERQLAQSYAAFLWRINRAAAIEDALFSLGILEELAAPHNIGHPEAHNAVSYAKTFRLEADHLEKLSLYSGHLVDQAGQIIDRLRHLQAERRESREEEMTEASRLYLFHRMQNQRFDPPAHGFALTVSDIQHDIERRKLAGEAREAEGVGFDAARFGNRQTQAAG